MSSSATLYVSSRLISFSVPMNEEQQDPIQALGPHVAALGMQFYTGNMFPDEYKNSIFIAQHGSWNRKEPIGGHRLVLHTSLNHQACASFSTLKSRAILNLRTNQSLSIQGIAASSVIDCKSTINSFVAFSVIPGYRVVEVGFDGNGKVKRLENFADGWLNRTTGKSCGRPVDVAQLRDGSLLISDDDAGDIYRISYAKKHN